MLENDNKIRDHGLGHDKESQMARANDACHYKQAMEEHQG